MTTRLKFGSKAARSVHKSISNSNSFS